MSSSHINSHICFAVDNVSVLSNTTTCAGFTQMHSNIRSLYSSSNSKVTASASMTNTNNPVSCSASSRREGVIVCSESRQHLCFTFIFSRTNMFTCLASSVQNVTQAFHDCVSAAVARVSRVMINMMPRPCFTFVVASNSLSIVSHASLSTATNVFHVYHR